MMESIETIRSKIIQLEDIAAKAKQWKSDGEKIVFTNGCFDILHLGHIDYLSKAFDLGDKLIIGLNTDRSVRELKGDNRPINDQNSRAKILASMFFVSAVVLFDDETPYNLIKQIIPDVLVKGSDYDVEEIVGHDIIVNNGGLVKTIQFLDGYSSSSIINKIRKL